jgi:hypothetical protein
MVFECTVLFLVLFVAGVVVGLSDGVGIVVGADKGRGERSRSSFLRLAFGGRELVEVGEGLVTLRTTFVLAPPVVSVGGLLSVGICVALPNKLDIDMKGIAAYYWK